MTNQQQITKTEPFLRWAGGKRWFTKNILELLPRSFNNYHEPFLGSGAIYFYLKGNDRIRYNSFLSDTNRDLVTTYSIISSHPSELINLLRGLRNTKEDYYRIRSSIPKTDLEVAAKFIYLNKTSYNGLYRVNRNGEYNVPYGNRTLKNLTDYENIKSVSNVLSKNTFLFSGDFDAIRDNVRENDLIFLDPPYTVAHENNGFVEYNQSIFTWEDQIRLSELIQYINNIGAFYIMTNAKHESIEQLFSPYGNSIVFSRHSTIGGVGASRKSINEYVFKNF
jgi:DNA adenine methylase